MNVTLFYCGRELEVNIGFLPQKGEVFILDENARQKLAFEYKGNPRVGDIEHLIKGSFIDIIVILKPQKRLYTFKSIQHDGYLSFRLENEPMAGDYLLINKEGETVLEGVIKHRRLAVNNGMEAVCYFGDFTIFDKGKGD